MITPVLSVLSVKLPGLRRFPMPHASFLQGVNSRWYDPMNWFGAAEILALHI